MIPSTKPGMCTLGNSYRPQNTIDEENSIEALATCVNVMLELPIVRVRQPCVEYVVKLCVVEHVEGVSD